MHKIQQVAEERLRQIASTSTKVLFVCEQAERKSLDAFLKKSKVFEKIRHVMVDCSEAQKLDSALEGATFRVVYTHDVKAAPFIDGVIDKAIAKKSEPVT